jgi:hypothetical protein
VKTEPEQEGRVSNVRSVLASSAIALIGVTIAVYLALVVSGRVPQSDRFGAAELSLAVLGTVLVLLAINPAAFDRLNLLKLPGGIEVTLERIQAQQHEQRQELNLFFSIISNMLSPPEKFHLRALGRGDDEYVGQGSLREELHRLKRFGLLDEVPGQKIGDIFDGKAIKLSSFVSLTSQGKGFIRSLDEIER